MIRFPKVRTFAMLLAATAPGLAEPAFHGEIYGEIYGSWARGDGVARVEIAPCGDAICATNTWIKPGVQDEKVGDRLVMTVEPSGAAAMSGMAFDPQRNLKYRLKISLAGKTMTTRGCVLGGLFCKNMGWTRLSGE